MPPTIAERLTASLDGRYVLERELGAGGMATVWLARDVRHDRAVALKVLRPELTAVLGAERFLAEIRLTARLDHPHILTLIDSGEADGLLFYVLPYVRGESLRARIDREKQLPIDEAVRLVRQAASALAYAHSHGVVHRDIKPENILLHEGEAVVTDFGIALALREAGGTRLTETGLSLGTPQYMSPEQATGDRDLDARSDVYSLGAVLYELLTGDPPHAGSTVQAVIAKLLSERPTAPRTLRVTVPEALESAVLRALAKVPADRFTGAAAFGDAISAALVPPARTTQQTTNTNGRRAAWPMIAAGFALGLLAAAGGWAAFGRTSKGAAQASAPATGRNATFSGDVIDFALAPDGQRLALGRLDCSEQGRCQTLVQVRDVQGGVALPLAQFLATYDMRFSPDGRFVLVTGADSTGRFGMFRVAALSGPVTYLGVYMKPEPIGQLDSLLVGMPSPGGLRLGVLVPGDATIRDSTPMPGLREFALAPEGDRLVLVFFEGTQPVLRLTDRRYRVLDSLVVPSFYTGAQWSPTGDALYWIANSPEGLSVVRVAIDRAADSFRGSPVTVTVPFDMPQSFAGRRLDLANDGTLAYVRGLTPRVLHLMRRARGGVLPSVVRRIEEQTGRLRAFASPDGGTIAFSRLVPGVREEADQLVSYDVRTGAERELSPPLDDFVDAEWIQNGAALIYASYRDSVGTQFTRWEPATGRRRAVGTYPGRRLELIWALPDESLLTIGADGSTVEVLAPERGTVTRRLSTPRDQELLVLASSPDGARLATMAWSASGDSLVMGRIDMSSGQYTELARVFAEGSGSMRWLADGAVEFVVTTTVSASDLYRLDPDRGTLTRIGELPVPFASYNLSFDGKWAAAVERRVVSNVFVVRP